MMHAVLHCVIPPAKTGPSGSPGDPLLDVYVEHVAG